MASDPLEHGRPHVQLHLLRHPRMVVQDMRRAVPAAHQIEEHQVLEGRFDVVDDGDWRTLVRRESATVPANSTTRLHSREGTSAFRSTLWRA
jgi:hypothetical protein